MSRKSMITLAKESHAEKIANLVHKDKKLVDGMIKDLMKLNYTTLVELSPRVKSR